MLHLYLSPDILIRTWKRFRDNLKWTTNPNRDTYSGRVKEFIRNPSRDYPSIFISPGKMVIVLYMALRLMLAQMDTSLFHLSHSTSVWIWHSSQVRSVPFFNVLDIEYWKWVKQFIYGVQNVWDGPVTEDCLVSPITLIVFVDWARFDSGYVPKCISHTWVPFDWRSLWNIWTSHGLTPDYS